MLVFKNKRILWTFGNDSVCIRNDTTEQVFNKLKAALYKKYGGSYGLFEVRSVIDLL